MKDRQNASPQEFSNLIRSRPHRRRVLHFFHPRHLHHLRLHRHPLHQQRPLQHRLQQMFPRRHKGRRRFRVFQPRRPHNQRIDGSFHSQTSARFHAAFPQRARQTQHSPHRAHRLPLLFRQSRKSSLLHPRLISPLIPHSHPQQIPLRLRPSHRQRQPPQKLPRRLFRRLRPQPRSNSMQLRRGLHHFAMLLGRKCSAGLQPRKLPV